MIIKWSYFDGRSTTKFVNPSELPPSVMSKPCIYWLKTCIPEFEWVHRICIRDRGKVYIVYNFYVDLLTSGTDDGQRGLLHYEKDGQKELIVGYVRRTPFFISQYVLIDCWKEPKFRMFVDFKNLVKIEPLFGYPQIENLLNKVDRYG